MFLNPFFLWLLPIALTPLIWHLYRKVTQKNILVPSLYFINKVLEKKRNKFLFTSIFEMILEIMFIAFLILAFASPQRQISNETPKRFIVFVDNSPSMFVSNDKQTKIQYFQNKIYPFFKKNFKKYPFYFFTINDVKEGLFFRPIQSEKDFNRFFDSLKIYNSSFDFQDLNKYLKQQKELVFDFGSELIFLSDLGENHFLNKEEKIKKRIYIPRYTKASVSPLIISIKNNRSLYFQGDVAKIKVHLELKGGGEVQAVLKEKNKVIFLKTIDFHQKEKRIIQIDVPLDDQGTHYYYLEVLQNNSVKDFYFFTIFASPQIKLKIVDLSKEKEYTRLISRLFSYDIKKKNIVLDSLNSEILINFFPNRENIQLKNQKGSLIFLPHKKDVKQLTDLFKAYSVFNIDINKEKIYNKPLSPLSGQIFKGFFSIFNYYFSWKDLVFWQNYEMVSHDFFIENVFYLQTRQPFLIKKENQYLFLFDPHPDFCNFLTTSSSIVILSQCFLSLSKRLQTKYVSVVDRSFEDEHDFLCSASMDRYLIALGIFKDNGQEIVLNRDLKELTAKKLKNINKVFPDIKQSLVFTDASLTRGASFSIRKLLIFIDFVIFIVLVLLFNRESFLKKAT